MCTVNSDRLWQDVMTLANYTEPNRPWTRRSFTKRYNEGRDWLKSRMEEASLEVEVDAAANIIGKRKGLNHKLPPIVIGSHTDTVPDGGRFDGIVGVLAGLEALRALDEQRIKLDRTVELVDFTAEEPSVYGLSTVGSRAWSGNLTDEMLTYTNANGETLSSAIQYAGGDPDKIKAVKRESGSICLYLELHIEQGPVLLEKKSSLGIVSGIVGIRRYRVCVEGSSNHAGTTPMHLRKDALNGACAMSLSLEKLANNNYSKPVVATVGEFTNFPNASNVIPGRIEFTVEIRSISTKVLNEVSEQFLKQVNQIGKARDLKVETEEVSFSNPISIKDNIKSLLFKACEQITSPIIELPSGAGHDANQMSFIGPVGMLFIPCKGGRSHCPEEWAKQKDLAIGATAILNVIKSFSKINSERKS